MAAGAAESLRLFRQAVSVGPLRHKPLLLLGIANPELLYPLLDRLLFQRPLELIACFSKSCPWRSCFVMLNHKNPDGR